MIRAGVFFTLIMVTINAGLFVTGEIKDNGAFRNLSTELNRIAGVNAQADISPEAENNIAAGNLFSSISGGATLIFSIGINTINIAILMLFGYITIFNLVDPTNSWALIIIAPLAVIQIYFVIFILITIIQALAAALNSIIPG